MKLHAPFLLERFQRPDEWKDAILSWLADNYGEVGIPKVIMEAQLYDAQVMAAKTNTTFFKTPSGVGPAFNNLNGNMQRATNEHFIIVGIQFMQGLAATIDIAPWAYGTSDLTLKQGYFSIQNNTDIVLRNMPMTAFNPNLTTEDQGMCWLTEPFLWLGNTTFNINVEAQNAGTATLNGKFILHGFGLFS